MSKILEEDEILTHMSVMDPNFILCSSVKIRNALRAHRNPMSANELVEATGEKYGCVLYNLRQMVKDGLVVRRRESYTPKGKKKPANHYVHSLTARGFSLKDMMDVPRETVVEFPDFMQALKEI